MKVALTVSDGHTEPSFLVVENAELYSEQQLLGQLATMIRRHRGTIPATVPIALPQPLH